MYTAPWIIPRKRSIVPFKDPVDPRSTASVAVFPSAVVCKVYRYLAKLVVPGRGKTASHLGSPRVVTEITGVPAWGIGG